MAEGTKKAMRSRLARMVAEFGDEPVALYEDARYSWTYVGRIKAFLDEALSDADATVPAALLLRQRPNSLAAAMSLWAQGRCVNLLSPLRPDQGIIDDVVELGPAIILADSVDWVRPGFADACADAVCVELRAGIDEPVRYARTPPTSRRNLSPAPEAHAATIATSGTTGPPKRYAIAWDDLASGTIERDPSDRRGVVINVLPLFSIGGVRAIAATMFGGRPIALMDRVDVVEWARLIHEHKPRRAGAPPAILRMVLDAKIPPEWLRSVKSIYTASAALSMQLADEFEKVYDIPILQGYGATEFLGGVTGWPGDLHKQWGTAKRGSVGRALPGIDLRVVDSATGAVLAGDEVGNLEVDSPYRAQGVPGGWVPTNDLARIDKDGFVWILGRSDDVIIRGGFKIHLLEVEAVLLDHPRVVDACVVGLPDERLGEIPAALVVTDGTEPPDEFELIEIVRRRLPPYMAPVLISRHEEMPLNAMLKKDRHLIISLLMADMQKRKQSA